jgi:hypothetical protein
MLPPEKEEMKSVRVLGLRNKELSDRAEQLA